MEDLAQFAQPMEMPRPRGAHRIEAFSPKLGRRVRLYSHDAFRLWLCLESDPLVVAFCERPGFVQIASKRVLAEFWVHYQTREELLYRAHDCGADDNADTDARIQTIDNALPVRAVTPVELRAAQVWIDNWQLMLPCIVATRALHSKHFLHALEHALASPQQLMTIERTFRSEDIALLRGALFGLLHAGRLSAPALHTAPLSGLTPFARASEDL